MNTIDKRKKPVQVIIYTRVSSARQVREGHGLESQRLSCEKYCQRKGYKIIKVFEERGISGDGSERPEYEKAVTFAIDAAKDKSVHILLLADELSRFNRNDLGSSTLYATAEKCCFEVNSVKEEFEDSIHGQFARAVMSSVAALFLKENKQRVISRMDAQNSKGRRMYGALPAWYQPGTNATMIPFQPNARILAQTYERLATGELSRKRKDIIQFMTEQGFTDKKTGQPRPLTRHQAEKVVHERNIWEAAGLTYYDGQWIQGTHEALISVELAEKVLRAIKGDNKRKARFGLNAFYPLRGELRCAACGGILTGCGSDYRYYYCTRPGCDDRSSGTRTEIVHSQFEELLTGVIPSKHMLKAAQILLENIWQKRKADFDGDLRRWRTDITTCEKGIEAAIQDARNVKAKTLKTPFTRK